MPLKPKIHSSVIIDENVKIGDYTKIWHFSHIQKNVRIGKNCTLGQNTNIANNVSIGDFVKIQNNVSIYEGVTLEDYVFCGPSVVFTNVIFPRSQFPHKGPYVRTKIKEGASLGANSTILCGITIGKFAMIGAGAVVTKSVPDYSLSVGNPLKFIGWVCKCGFKLNFIDSESICANCFQKYLLKKQNIVVEI